MIRPLSAIRSLFLPEVPAPPMPSRFEGRPDQARRERPLRSTTEQRWLQSDVPLARQMADNGDLSMAARLADACRADGTCGGILSTRAGGLTRLPKVFRGTPAVVAELDTTPEGPGLFDRVFGSTELEKLDADGIMLGVGVGELIYLSPDDAMCEPTFVRLEPEHLRYNWTEDTWYYNSFAGRLPITPGDGRWILHTPGGHQAPWKSGRFPSLGRAYISKDHAINYRENFSGKLANAARAAVQPAGATERQRKNFIRNLIDWGVNTVFELPPGWDVKVIESNGMGYQVYSDTIKTSDLEFMVDLAGQIVTITGGAGFANADIHETIRADIIQSDGNALARTINQQGLRQIVNRRHGAAARGSMAWNTDRPDTLKNAADAIKSAGDSISTMNQAIAQYGQRVDLSEMAKRFKLPLQALEQAVSETTPPVKLSLVKS